METQGDRKIYLSENYFRTTPGGWFHNGRVYQIWLSWRN
jgi:hypothetical protein